MLLVYWVSVIEMHLILSKLKKHLVEINAVCKKVLMS
jgi:hypothetical protein